MSASYRVLSSHLHTLFVTLSRPRSTLGRRVEAFFSPHPERLHLRVLGVDFVRKCALNGVVLLGLILSRPHVLHNTIDTDLDKGDSSLGLIVYDNFFSLISLG